MPRLIAFASLALALGACQKPDHISIEPKAPVIRTASERMQLVSHVMSGTFEHVKEQVTWSTEDPEIAVIEGNGVLIGKSGGRTRVVAKYGELTATVPVEIAFVEKLVSDMTEVVLDYELGDPVKPHLDALGYDGRKLKDRTIFFEPKDRKICRVDSGGQIWPGDRGETIVYAKLEGQVVEIKCTVK